MNLLKKAEQDGAKIYLETAGINIISGKRDLDAFENEVFEEKEKILCIVTGKLVQISNDRYRGIGFGMGNRQATGTDTKGVLLITNKKAMFLDKRIFGKQKIVINGADITSISQSTGIISAKIIIKSFGSQYDITDLKKDAAVDCFASLNILKKHSKSNDSTIINKSSSGMEEIKKAKELWDDGVISEKEFNEVKKKYL